jgi:hypothetical protein
MTTGTELVAASDTGVEIVPRGRCALRYVSILAAAAPALLIIMVTVQRTHIPSSDELDFAITSAYRHGALSSADFCARHDELRILFPNLVMSVGQ